MYRCQTSALYAVTPYAKQPNCCGLTLAYLTAHCFPQTLRWLHCHLVSNSSLCGPSGALAQGYWGLNLLAWRVLMTVFENVALFDWSINQKRNPPLKKTKQIYIHKQICTLYRPNSVTDPDPWNPYQFPGSGSGSVSKNGWIRNPDDTDPDPTIENRK